MRQLVDFVKRVLPRTRGLRLGERLTDTRHGSATRVTVFLAFNPLTAAALGHWLLHEPLDRWIGIAVVLIAAGLWLATRSPTAGRRR